MGSLGARGAGPCGWICIKLHKNHLGSIYDNILMFRGKRLTVARVKRLHTYIQIYIQTSSFISID